MSGKSLRNLGIYLYLVVFSLTRQVFRDEIFIVNPNNNLEEPF